MFQFAVGAPAARPATPPGARARPLSVPTGAEGLRFAAALTWRPVRANAGSRR